MTGKTQGLHSKDLFYGGFCEHYAPNLPKVFAQTMNSFFSSPFALLIALCSFILVSGCKPSGEEQVNGMIVKLDQAFLAYKGGDYDQFYELLSETRRTVVYIEPFSGVPDRTNYTARNGRCDLSAIREYHHSLSGDLERMISLMQGKRLSFAEYDLIASSLRLISWDVKQDTTLHSKHETAQYQDCDRYFPGYSDRIEAVDEYTKESLPQWLALYKEIYGRDAIEQAEGLARARQMSDLNNWGGLSEQEKEYFTLGDSEVEACVNAFIGDSAPSAEIASTDDVARLCREGLD